MRLFNKVLTLSVVSLGAIALASCDSKNQTSIIDTSTETPSSVTDVNVDTKYDLSSNKYDIDKEYYYNDYNSLADYTIFEDKNNIVFDSVSYEELVYLLESDGNHLILFGGSWCGNTKASIGYINQLANEYKIDTIYNFDFRLDGETRDSHIRETNTSTAKASEYNYLYGELVTRYLTNLTDWVEYKETSASALTYTDSNSTDVTVAKAQVPFLFLYNKDNKVDNSGNNGSLETYPIVYGYEEMVNRDANGVFTAEYNEDWSIKSKTYITDDYISRLRGIFDYIKNNNVKLAEYSAANYIKESFNEKSGAQLFSATDKVNINTVTYRELTWLLQQEGNSIILLGGSWCGNTRAVINTINDYAVANNVIVYIYDTKLDSGISKSKFGYSKDLNTRSTDFGLVGLYTNLIENYFTNIVTLYDKTDNVSSHKIEYTNSNGERVSVAKAQVPYLLAYNKDNKDSIGLAAPITAYYEEMLVLNPESESYIYKTENYTRYSNGVKNVFKAYKDEVVDISLRETK